MTLLITMSTKSGIFMIADSLEVEDINGRVTPAGKIDKLDRVNNLDVILSFWGTLTNPTKNFNLIEELKKFEANLINDDNVLTVASKIKNYFEKLDILDDDDNLGFHICGYVGVEAYIHHVHHISRFRKSQFKNEDSKREFRDSPRYIGHPILFNGDNKIPNLFINLLGYLHDRVVYADFDRQQAKEFLIFLMDTAIRLQRFSNNSLTSGILIDYPLRFCEINEENIYIEKIQNRAVDQ